MGSLINLQKKLENKKNELVSAIIQPKSDSSDNEVQISNLLSSLSKSDYQLSPKLLPSAATANNMQHCYGSSSIKHCDILLYGRHSCCIATMVQWNSNLGDSKNSG